MESRKGERREYWRRHLSAAKAQECSLAAYARENILLAESLYIWRRKLESEESSWEVSPFVRAEVLPQQRARLDAQWAAEFVLHLLGGAR